jgi:UDP-N-acetylglucosamine pyrophosphorylase
VNCTDGDANRVDPMILQYMITEQVDFLLEVVEKSKDDLMVTLCLYKLW